MKTIDDLLEDFQIEFPGEWDECPKGFEDWFAVSDTKGVIAYFDNEKDACGFRLYKINQFLNG